MLWSNSTTVSLGQSFLRISSRKTTSPGFSISRARILMDCSGTPVLRPAFRSSRARRSSSNTPKRTRLVNGFKSTTTSVGRVYHFIDLSSKRLHPPSQTRSYRHLLNRLAVSHSCHTNASSSALTFWPIPSNVCPATLRGDWRRTMRSES